MKIWKSFSSDHSDKLRIIGKFKTSKDAQDAAIAFNELLDCKSKFIDDPDYPYSEAFREIMDKHKVYLNPSAGEDFNYLYPMHPEKNKIIVETDDFAIQAVSQIFNRYGAKIEIYSRHNYPD